jgi:hypothetical protein
MSIRATQSGEITGRIDLPLLTDDCDSIACEANPIITLYQTTNQASDINISIYRPHAHERDRHRVCVARATANPDATLRHRLESRATRPASA